MNSKQQASSERLRGRTICAVRKECFATETYRSHYIHSGIYDGKEIFRAQHSTPMAAESAYFGTRRAAVAHIRQNWL